MPNLNPLLPGDTPYPQYSVTVTQKTTAIQITKGVVYTKDGVGRLIVSALTLERGLFQSRVTPDAVSALDDGVQVLAPRSRILMQDIVGGLVEGDDVILTANTDQVVTGAKASLLYLGKVIEIYTKDSNGSKKQVTVANDYVIIDTVGP